MFFHPFHLRTLVTVRVSVRVRVCVCVYIAILHGTHPVAQTHFPLQDECGHSILCSMSVVLDTKNVTTPDSGSPLPSLALL